VTRNVHSFTVALATSHSTNLSVTLAKGKSGFHWPETETRMAPSVSLGFTQQLHALPFRTNNGHMASLRQGSLISYARGIVVTFCKEKLQLHHSYWYQNCCGIAKAMCDLG